MIKYMLSYLVQYPGQLACSVHAAITEIVIQPIITSVRYCTMFVCQYYLVMRLTISALLCY